MAFLKFSDLTKEGKRKYRQLEKRFDPEFLALDEHKDYLLEVVKTWQRVFLIGRQLDNAAAKNGWTTEGRFGDKPHPLIDVLNKTSRRRDEQLKTLFEMYNAWLEKRNKQNKLTYDDLVGIGALNGNTR